MTVVAFKPKQKKSSTRVAQEKWVDLISTEITKKMKSGKKIYQITEEVGLSQSTISKLIYRETRFPRMATMVALLTYLGYEIYAETKINA